MSRNNVNKQRTNCINKLRAKTEEYDVISLNPVYIIKNVEPIKMTYQGFEYVFLRLLPAEEVEAFSEQINNSIYLNYSLIPIELLQNLCDLFD